jgi:hypothetical protein
MEKGISTDLVGRQDNLSHPDLFHQGPNRTLARKIEKGHQIT